MTAGKSAQAISERIAQVTQEAFENGVYIFFVIDCHEERDEFHPEAQLFPSHNIIGTQGRDLYGPLADFYQKHKGHARVRWMDKRHYSTFSGTDLDVRLRERGVDTVVLTGGGCLIFVFFIQLLMLIIRGIVLRWSHQPLLH